MTNPPKLRVSSSGMDQKACDQSETVAFLSAAKSYGIDGSVDVHQTHGSTVFLAGARAYKLKRAVKFPYMDYSTPARRRAMCERELVVNQRMAPALYEGVRSVVKDRTGWHFGTPDDANAVDWVVVMHRFEQGDLFEERRKAGRLKISDMLALAEAIADFHHNAPVSHSFGGASGIRAVVDENVAILQNCAGDLLPAERVATYAMLSQSWLRNARAVLGSRRQKGFVRQCHGDLHLNNICAFAGKPVLFDAIEFADAFSSIDVAYDLAFVLMDLDSHGMRSHANALLNRYLECRGDHAGLFALPLFLACRAAIRAHVTLASPAKAQEAKAGAAALLEAAISYLQPDEPQLIAVGGLSGTGKSLLARSLAPSIGRSPGAIVLRSDVIRKSMFGVAQTERLGETAYDLNTTSAVYDKLCDRAASTLRAGHSVIADAVFGDFAQRLRLESMARDAGVAFRGIWLTAPRTVLAERISQRSGDASDATLAVLEAQIASVSVPEDWARVSAEGPVANVVAETERVIRLGAKGAL